MYFRLFSDIHQEFGPFEIPALDTDKDTVLILAGDIGVADKPSTYRDLILDAVSRFKHVIYIMGNHEHYHGSILRSIEKIKRAVGEHENLSVIDNEYVLLDGVAFVCSTLWTDFNGGNPMSMLRVQHGLNDYNLIRTGPEDNPYERRITAQDIYAEHRGSLSFLVDAITLNKEAGHKIVVVTHHGPSYQSVADEFKGSDLNAGYVSDLDKLIEELQPDYWCHGHTHHCLDYNIGDTNIITNTRGYVGHERVEGFDPEWVIEL